MIRLPSLTYIASHSRAAFLRFPYVLICACLCAILSIILIENESNDFWFTKLFMTIGLGIPLFFSLTLYLEKPLPSFKPSSILLLGGGSLLLVGFYFLSADALTKNFYMDYAQWALVFHLLASFSPFLAKKETNGFWQFNRSIFLRFCLSFLYASVFYVGMVMALAALDHLLNIKIHDKLYFDLWVFSVFVLQTWHFLAGLPEDLGGLDRVNDYPAALKVFTQYLLVPLVTLYTLILYIYLGKVLILWDWPKGTVTWLVSFVALAGVFNLLLLYPAEGKKENSWIKAYSRGFYLVLFPLVLMLFLSVGKRMEQYGITEQRYFVTALGVWILGIAFYFLTGKDRSIKTVPLTLFLIVLLTSFGPWGAYDVSRSSQMGRLQGYFVKNGMWKDGKTVKTTGEVPLEDRREISSILDYLVENHGVAPISKWFDLDLSKWDKGSERMRYGYSSVAKEICGSLGFEYVSEWESKKGGEYFSYYTNQMGMVLSVGGYDYLLELGLAGKEFTLEGVKCKWNLSQDKLMFNAPGGKGITFDLGALLQKAAASPEGMKKEALPGELLTLETENDYFRGRLVLRSFSGNKKNGGAIFNYPEGYLLLKRK